MGTLGGKSRIEDEVSAVPRCRNPHCWPSRLGGTIFQVPQILDLAGRDGDLAEQRDGEPGPSIGGGRPVEQAGHQALDAEPAVAIGPAIPGENPLAVGPFREDPVNAREAQVRRGWPSSSTTRPVMVPQGRRRMVRGPASSPLR